MEINLRPTQQWMDEFYAHCASIPYSEASVFTLFWAQCISNKKGELPIRFADGTFPELQARYQRNCRPWLEPSADE